MSRSLFAGLRVRDIAAARDWYAQLLGDPSFSPHDKETVWEIAGDRYVYVLEDPEHAGRGLVTLFVDDLDGELAQIASRGLEPSEHETYSNGVRKATFRDPDGNELGFGGPPA